MIRGQIPSANEAFSQALRSGNIPEAHRLLESGAIKSASYEDLLQSVRLRDLEILDTLLAFPEIQAVITAHNNEAFKRTAWDGHIDIVNRLLQFPAVVAAIAAYDNGALRWAVMRGHLAVVNRLLEFPAVVDNITANYNEALRNALHMGRDEIVARLRQIPAVLAYEAAHPDPMAAGVGLAAVAQDNESSIRALSSAEMEGLSTLKGRYASQFQEQGLEAILSDLRKHLFARYQGNPAQHNGKALPLQYHGKLEKEANAQYYQNPYHTAYRYLFCQPNPWMDPTAVWVDRNAQGAQANISDASKESIAYLWLAASDKALPMPSGYTREDIQNRFIDLLADAGRGHNWDKKRKKTITKNQVPVEIEEHYDDGEGDKPSCSLGVTRRTVAQFLVLLQPDVKSLNKEAIHAQFTENLVTQNSQKNGLFDKIMSLDLNTLTALNSALDNLVGVAAKIEYLNKKEQALLKEVLSVDAGALKSFMAQCQQDFGERLSAKVALTWDGDKFDSYQKLIQYFAQNTFTIFYTALKTKCESQLRTLTPSKPVTPVALRTPAPLASATSTSAAPLLFTSKKPSRKRQSEVEALLQPSFESTSSLRRSPRLADRAQQARKTSEGRFASKRRRYRE